MVFHRVERTRAGKGLHTAPFFRKIISQRITAAVEVTHGLQKFNRVRIIPKNDGIDHAAQVRTGQVLVLLFNHHRTRKLFGRDQQIDDRLFGVVVFANHSQNVFGGQLRQHHHQGSIALGVGQLDQCALGTDDVASGNEGLGLGNQCEVVCHHLVLAVEALTDHPVVAGFLA